jgi:hypothetical protein
MKLYRHLTCSAISVLLASSGLLLLAAEPAAQAAATEPGAGKATTAKLLFATPLHWKSSGVLLKPVSDEQHNHVSIKDPTVVRYDNNWHVYATIANTQGALRPVAVSARASENGGFQARVTGSVPRT